MTKSYFLPYQKRWLGDNSRIKIWEKSRRIGATYVASFEDVRDAHAGTVPSCWFSSADESAAREYIEYCAKWAGLYNYAAEILGEQVIDKEKNIKTYQIDIKNKHGKKVKIHALSSNPKAFRSKGGKVTLDEFAWHDDAKAMWAAARPCITWGFPLRILSTHNGVNSLYNQFIEKINIGKLNWSLHTTDIFRAVEDGLADKIMRRKLTDEERSAWIEQERESVADDTTWEQEYCCKPQDEAAAFLTYEMIRLCEREDILKPLSSLTGDIAIYAGMDIARKKHLSVIIVLEKVGSFYMVRMIYVLEKMKFRDQKTRLYEILRHPRMRRACIDATGIGMQLAEDAQLDFGRFRVEPVTFTGPVKEDMAYRLYRAMEDVSLLVPNDYKLREDLHSVRKVTTAAGNIRFDVHASEKLDSHADRFWSLALGLHAAQEVTGGNLEITSRERPNTRDSDEIVTGRRYIDDFVKIPSLTCY